MEDVATEESAFVQEDVLAVIKEVRCRCSRGGRHTVLRANFFIPCCVFACRRWTGARQFGVFAHEGQAVDLDGARCSHAAAPLTF